MPDPLELVHGKVSVGIWYGKDIGTYLTVHHLGQRDDVIAKAANVILRCINTGIFFIR